VGTRAKTTSAPTRGKTRMRACGGSRYCAGMHALPTAHLCHFPLSLRDGAALLQQPTWRWPPSPGSRGRRTRSGRRLGQGRGRGRGRPRSCEQERSLHVCGRDTHAHTHTHTHTHTCAHDRIYMHTLPETWKGEAQLLLSQTLRDVVLLVSARKKKTDSRTYNTYAHTTHTYKHTRTSHVHTRTHAHTCTHTHTRAHMYGRCC
jgi:hypothetical protein